MIIIYYRYKHHHSIQIVYKSKRKVYEHMLTLLRQILFVFGFEGFAQSKTYVHRRSVSLDFAKNKVQYKF